MAARRWWWIPCAVPAACFLRGRRFDQEAGPILSAARQPYLWGTTTRHGSGPNLGRMGGRVLGPNVGNTGPAHPFDGSPHAARLWPRKTRCPSTRGFAWRRPTATPNDAGGPCRPRGSALLCVLRVGSAVSSPSGPYRRGTGVRGGQTPIDRHFSGLHPAGWIRSGGWTLGG